MICQWDLANKNIWSRKRLLEQFSIRALKSLRTLNSILPELRKRITDMDLDFIQHNYESDGNMVPIHDLVMLFNVGSYLSDFENTMQRPDYLAWVVADVLNQPNFPTEWTLKLKTNTRDVLMSTRNYKNLDKIFYKDYTISHLIDLLLECVKFKLYDTVQYFANILMSVANKYAYFMHDQTICGTSLEFLQDDFEGIKPDASITVYRK